MTTYTFSATLNTNPRLKFQFEVDFLLKFDISQKSSFELPQKVPCS